MTSACLAGSGISQPAAHFIGEKIGLIIFGWDDTLFPSRQWRGRCRVEKERAKMFKEIQHHDTEMARILKPLAEHYVIKISSNGSEKWLEETTSHMPQTLEVLGTRPDATGWGDGKFGEPARMDPQRTESTQLVAKYRAHRDIIRDFDSTPGNEARCIVAIGATPITDLVPITHIAPLRAWTLACLQNPDSELIRREMTQTVERNLLTINREAIETNTLNGRPMTDQRETYRRNLKTCKEVKEDLKEKSDVRRLLKAHSARCDQIRDEHDRERELERATRVPEPVAVLSEKPPWTGCPVATVEVAGATLDEPDRLTMPLSDDVIEIDDAARALQASMEDSYERVVAMSAAACSSGDEHLEGAAWCDMSARRGRCPTCGRGGDVCGGSGDDISICEPAETFLGFETDEQWVLIPDRHVPNARCGLEGVSFVV